MPVERRADHPTFDLGGNVITSFAALARGSEETLIRDDGSELVPDWVR